MSVPVVASAVAGERTDPHSAFVNPLGILDARWGPHLQPACSARDEEAPGRHDLLRPGQITTEADGDVLSHNAPPMDYAQEWSRHSSYVCEPSPVEAAAIPNRDAEIGVAPTRRSVLPLQVFLPFGPIPLLRGEVVPALRAGGGGGLSLSWLGGQRIRRIPWDSWCLASVSVTHGR